MRRALLLVVVCVVSATLVSCRWPATNAAQSRSENQEHSQHHSPHRQTADRAEQAEAQASTRQGTRHQPPARTREATGSFQDSLRQQQAELNSLGAGQVLNCTLDETLPPVPEDTKFIIAALLHNSEEILSNFIPQLLAVVAAIPAGNVFVSMYESGSTDNTGKGMALLRAMLDELRVSNQIVIDGEKRGKGEERIAFLARMRNLALAPLWQAPAGAAGPAGSAGQTEPFPADRIVFINDIYFCASDILRLMASDGDLVCAMDMHTWRPGATWHEFNQKYRPWGAFGPQLAEELEAHKEHLLFYDTWVARDALGLPFSNFRPFVHHQYSLQRLQAGLPFHVTCCWNGVVVLNAQPFVKGRLRFRVSEPGECEAGEVGNMCKDLLQSGHRHMLLDPGVRVAYTYESAQQLHGPLSSFIAETTWADVQAAGDADLKYVPEHTMLTCCPLLPELDIIKDWNTCYPVDIHHEAGLSVSH